MTDGILFHDVIIRPSPGHPPDITSCKQFTISLSYLFYKYGLRR